MDFIGFTYNGRHSWRDLGIYRTSDGSRYNNNLTATMTDKTVDVPSGDGQYYFGTTFKNRTFTVNYAFDNLTEEKLQQLKTVFDGKGVHDLIFDETPDQVWSAKVTGTASIKYLCFDDDTLTDQYKRIYKGEGSITFTCYYPFARSVATKGGTSTGREGIITERIGGTVPTPFVFTIDFQYSDDLNTDDTESVLSTLTVNSNTITLVPAIKVTEDDIITWDSKTGIIKKGTSVCSYTGQGIATLEPNSRVTFSAEGTNLGENYKLKIQYKYLYS